MRRGTIALLLTVAWSAVGCVDGQRYDTQAAAELLPNGMSGPTDAPTGSCWLLMCAWQMSSSPGWLGP